MRGSDRERQILINKLKTIKDSKEREKILWALEGLKKEHYGPAGSAAEPAKASPPTERGKVPFPIKVPTNISQLARYGPPMIFILFGLVFIVQAIFTIMVGRDIQGAIGNLIMGSIFLIFGFFALRRVKLQGQVPEEPPEGAKKS